MSTDTYAATGQALDAARLERAKREREAIAALVEQGRLLRSQIIQDAEQMIEGEGSAAFDNTGPVAALTMTLGEINTRIAPLKIDQVGLAQLGIKSCGTDKRAVLYRADEWPATRAALIKHLEGC